MSNTTGARCIEPLEARRLLAASATPSPAEVYMLELYNRARMNPLWAASLYGVALNEGLAAGTITSDPKAPLALNPTLAAAARSHAQWMIDHDTFSHAGANNSMPIDRMKSAGYVFSGNWYGGENIALIYGTSLPSQTELVRQEFQNLYVDQGIDGRGHRTQMMSDAPREIGSGVASGEYKGVNGLITVQDFAASDGSFNGESFLTGVSYMDADHDDFYTPGEGLGGLTITAMRNSDGATFTTTTWSSGGYSLALPNGTYSVASMGDALGGIVKYDNVTLSGHNVKRDFRPDLVQAPGGSAPPFARLSGTTLLVVGTANDDTITVERGSTSTVATLNHQPLNFNTIDVKSIKIFSDGGDDNVSVSGSIGAYISTADGNDTVTGSDAPDRIYGGNGNDRISGGAGNDSLYGQFNNDTLNGGTGNDLLAGGGRSDRLSGGSGNDTADYTGRLKSLVVTIGGNTNGEAGENDTILTDVENVFGGDAADRITGSAFTNKLYGAGGNDTLTSMGGKDQLYGGPGRDVFHSNDGLKDYLRGGSGTDTADHDNIDSLLEIEA